MPCTGQGIWEPFGNFKTQCGINTIETLAFNGIVCSQPAQQCLCHKQHYCQENIFAQGFLRRSQLNFGNRVFGRNLHFLMLGQERITPHQQTDTHQQQHHTCERPHVVFSGGYVFNQRFVRPVVSVSKVFVRTVGRCGPRSPEEEVKQFLARFHTRQCIVFHCKVFACGLELGIVAIHTHVIRRNLFNRLHARIAQNNRPVSLNAALVAVFFGSAGFQHGFLLFGQLIKLFTVVFLSGKIQPSDQFAVQPVGRPVGCLIRTVSQNRTYFHTASGLPCRLAGKNIVFGHQHLTGRRNDFLGIRRCLFINLAAHVAEYGKTSSTANSKNQSFLYCPIFWTPSFGINVVYLIHTI